MAELYEVKQEREKVILVGVKEQEDDDTEKSLLELKELAKTAQADTLATFIQNRESAHPDATRLRRWRRRCVNLARTGLSAMTSSPPPR